MWDSISIIKRIKEIKRKSCLNFKQIPKNLLYFILLASINHLSWRIEEKQASLYSTFQNETK